MHATAMFANHDDQMVYTNTAQRASAWAMAYRMRAGSDGAGQSIDLVCTKKQVAAHAPSKDAGHKTSYLKQIHWQGEEI